MELVQPPFCSEEVNFFFQKTLKKHDFQFCVGKFKFTQLFAGCSELQMSFSTTATPLKRGDMGTHLGRGQKVKQKVLSFMDGSLALCSFASFAHPSPYITQIVSKLLES